MNDSVLDSIKQFVAGIITPREFRDRLYSDSTFEILLTNDPNLAASDYVFSSGGAYHFIIGQNFDDPSGVLNAQGALCDFMDRNHIDYSKTEQYSDLYDLILESQPKWLGVVDSRYIAQHMLPDSSHLKGDELKKWLAAEFRSRFRYVNKPPKWIQSPAWPIGENGPLVFLGQIEIKDYFHDTASAYIFHDPSTGRCETIVQVF